MCSKRVYEDEKQICCPKCQVICHAACFKQHLAECPSLLSQRMEEREDWRGPH